MTTGTEEAALEQLVQRALATRIVRSEPIAAGLGLRRFRRLYLAEAPNTAIARMDGPEDSGSRPAGVAPEPALEPIRAFLEAAGLPVPRRYGSDATHGIELLEDVGDATLEGLGRDGPAERRSSLYAQACSLVPKLQALENPTPGIPAFERKLDTPLFEYKAEQTARWLLPAVLGRKPSAAEIATVRLAFAEIAKVCSAAPQRLAHRDFKAQNLHLRSESAGGAETLVMIDLQGAFMAPPEYDLVCLLRDLHVSLPETEVAERLAATRPLLPDAPTPEDFERRFTLLTVSRVGKDLSRFLYAVQERGDDRYRRFLPAGARSLAAALERAAAGSPSFRQLAQLLDALEPQLQEVACGR
jgi:aminoglycoside/choline kinase family phosphotransferase